MITVTQIVNHASVALCEQKDTERSINAGYLIFLGVSNNDTEADLDKIVHKLLKLRIFSDANEKMNLDILSVKGEILLISQFTLLADLKGNNRPSFTDAAGKELALRLYELFTAKLIKAGLSVKTGFFGEHMRITSELKGPVTIILDSAKI